MCPIFTLWEVLVTLQPKEDYPQHEQIQRYTILIGIYITLLENGSIMACHELSQTATGRHQHIIEVEVVLRIMS
ncbi:hypothetical protein CEXT_319541 [Caerostris extrusa]|uniref:Uncharacterized protein n=1 Tax=Caerostris extrusa TaxID=172846 RepID=A0AAV4M9A5_CAEEX|nr:hypothetical protein CEXT_319541 [Caerostris extrusa]